MLELALSNSALSSRGVPPPNPHPPHSRVEVQLFHNQVGPTAQGRKGKNWGAAGEVEMAYCVLR
jgi:hypothetical protein